MIFSIRRQLLSLSFCEDWNWNVNSSKELDTDGWENCSEYREKNLDTETYSGNIYFLLGIESHSCLL